MKVVEGGEIHTVPEGWHVLCKSCEEQIEPGTQCFIEDTAWRNIYHVWHRPEAESAEPEPARLYLPRRRLVAEWKV